MVDCEYVSPTQIADRIFERISNALNVIDKGLLLEIAQGNIAGLEYKEPFAENLDIDSGDTENVIVYTTPVNRVALILSVDGSVGPLSGTISKVGLFTILKNAVELDKIFVHSEGKGFDLIMQGTSLVANETLTVTYNARNNNTVANARIRLIEVDVS